MSKKLPILMIPLLFATSLLSCNCPSAAPSGDPSPDLEARFSLPTLAELEGNRVGTLYLAPSIEGGEAGRFGARSGISLVSESGAALSWQDVGVGQTATLSRDGAGEIKKAIVHGDPEDAIFLWQGTAFFADGSVYFRLQSGMTFLYRAKGAEGSVPGHVAMKVRGKTQTIDDVAMKKEESEVLFSPNPSGFAGYEVFE